MNSNSTISTNNIRLRFTKAMSEMYQNEVPLYKQLLSLANDVNSEVLKDSADKDVNETRLLKLEHHGAIRVGTAYELSIIRRLFGVMGMQAVDYYDLSVVGIPVHSTAFRALEKNDIDASPFRVFCSLLRLDLINDIELKEKAHNLLNERNIFPEELLKLIDLSEAQDGLNEEQTKAFIENALEVFRWHENANVDNATYDQLKNSHALIADVVSFKGPHINHLTPKVLDIDECQDQFNKNNIKAKAIVEGPPKREYPILLRQTSFVAIAEDVKFTDGKLGSHTARFGEVEQRGIALTPKGRGLYDRLLMQARNADDSRDYSTRLKDAFVSFPDDLEQIRKQELAFFTYSISLDFQNDSFQDNADFEELVLKGVIEVKPVRYEDFLPVSAAGIFTSNLSKTSEITNTKLEISSGDLTNKKCNLESFEKALGVSVKNSFELYEEQQKNSLTSVMQKLNIRA